MKKIYLLFILFIIAKLCYSQKDQVVDTIFVSSKDKTYVIFPEPINWVDVGVTDYLKQTSGKSVFLIAKKDSLQPALLVIQYGDKFWHGTVAFKSHLSQNEQFVNLTDSPESQMPGMVNQNRVKEDKSKNLAQQIILKRMGVLEGKESIEETSFGLKNGKITFSLTIGRQDNEHYYLKMGVFNREKEDLVIGLVDLYYKDEDVTTDVPISEYARPVDYYSTEINKNKDPYSPAKGVTYLLYVIKKMKLSKKGYLEITMTEKNSSRSFTFTIDSDDLESFNNF